MAEPVSFYFQLFKKFQVLGHVTGEVDHGAQPPNPPSGGFSLLDPANAKAFSGPAGNTSLTANNLYQLLSTGAMPLGATQNYPPGWAEFETGGGGAPPNPTVVQDFATWTQAGSAFDIPNGVITQIPVNPPGQQVHGAVSPYVFSMPGDQGIRPDGVPGNYWATSLIYLVDPGSGNIPTLTTLAGGDEYWLAAVIGNNGDTDGGQYLSGSDTVVQAQAQIMVFNTTMGPGVYLPALSALDPNDTSAYGTSSTPDGTYDQYFLWNGSGNDSGGNPVRLNNNGTYPAPGNLGCYDVVGFRFNVQNTYDALIPAVQAAVTAGTLVLPPGVTTAQQFVLGTPTSPAHACAKVVVGQGPGAASFPSFSTSPLANAAIAQKNLVPFDLLLGTGPQPMFKCTHFVVGQPDYIQIPGAGTNFISLETTLPREQFRFYLSFRQETFKRMFGGKHKEKIRGFRQVTPKDLPEKRGVSLSPDAVVLQHEGGANRIEIPAFGNNLFHGVTMCVEYDPMRVQPGNLGEINIVHRALLPILTPGTRCFELQEAVAGGFTLQVRGVNPFQTRKAK